MTKRITSNIFQHISSLFNVNSSFNYITKPVIFHGEKGVILFRQYTSIYNKSNIIRITLEGKWFMRLFSEQ